MHDFEDSNGIVQSIHNTDSSIESFAISCFEYALDNKLDLWFSSKDTISKTYDHRFKDIFNDIYEKRYKDKFEEAGIEYFYTLIDDAIARVMKSEGGFVWACKNYDGDVFSDMLATAFGSLAMMTSVLVSPHGYYEYEAAHGTVTRHYHRYLQGENLNKPHCNNICMDRCLTRGELDGLEELKAFASKLEEAVLSTWTGYMTGDLVSISELPEKTRLDLEEFLYRRKENLEEML